MKRFTVLIFVLLFTNLAFAQTSTFTYVQDAFKDHELEKAEGKLKSISKEKMLLNFVDNPESKDKVKNGYVAVFGDSLSYKMFGRESNEFFSCGLWFENKESIKEGNIKLPNSFVNYIMLKCNDGFCQYDFAQDYDWNGTLTITKVDGNRISGYFKPKGEEPPSGDYKFSFSFESIELVK